MIGPNSQTGEQEIYLVDHRHGCNIQVFRVSDSRFLRGFRVPEIPSRGIALVHDHLLISCHNSGQILVLTQSEGKKIGVFGNDRAAWPHAAWPQLQQPTKLFVEPDGDEVFIVDVGHSSVFLMKYLTWGESSSGQFLRQYCGERQGEGKGKKGKPCLSPRAVVVHGEEVIIWDTVHEELLSFGRFTCRKLRRIPLPHNRGSATPPSIQHQRYGIPCSASDLAVNCHNQLFLCDTENHRVWVLE